MKIAFYVQHPNLLRGRRIHYVVADPVGLRQNEGAGPQPTVRDAIMNSYRTRRQSLLVYRSFPRTRNGVDVISRLTKIPPGTLALMRILKEAKQANRNVVSVRPMHNSAAWDGWVSLMAGPREVVVPCAQYLESHTGRAVRLGGSVPEDSSIKRIPGTRSSFSANASTLDNHQILYSTINGSTVQVCFHMRSAT
jgi:hypothetical protein